MAKKRLRQFCSMFLGYFVLNEQKTNNEPNALITLFSLMKNKLS